MHGETVKFPYQTFL